MVLHKRLDYGSSGYQVPAMPHVPKSARSKRSARKKAEESKMCAFNLLATVAGQLLTEGEKFVKEDRSILENSIKTELFDQFSCSDGLLHSEVVPKRNFAYDIKEQSHATEILASGPTLVKLDISSKDTIAEDSIVVDHESETKHLFCATPEKCRWGRHPSSSMESHKYKVMKTPTPGDRMMVGNVMDVNYSDLYSLEDPMEMDNKPTSLISSDSSAGVPAYTSKLPENSSFPKFEHNLELAIDKDDDENSSVCTQPGIPSNKTSRLQGICDRRIRKLLTSKCWNVAPTVAHENELSSYDVELKPVFRGNKMCYMHKRTHRGLFKRKKMLERRPLVKGGFCHRNLSNLCQKPGIKLEQSDSNATLHGVNGASSSLMGPKSSNQPPEYSVKLRVSSFKIPELFIDMPETATIGSLKRTIMESVTAILGGRLRVGVLLQGKKVRDDNKTLRQAGISRSDKLDNLGFMLEPDCAQVSAPLTTSKDLHMPSITTPSELSARIAPNSIAPMDEVVTDFTRPLLTISPESDHDSVYSPTDASCVDKITENSQALILVPLINTDAMTVVPLCNSRRSEVAQRRIRRPFSVAEVEALVQAVEKLGTGRWRDVKLSAFDNAKHRTYVDLKDKWKTLVHTARISPQQRRGEPVPQELLDRVLAAHAYWGQQQAKLQIKPPPAENCILI